MNAAKNLRGWLLREGQKEPEPYIMARMIPPAIRMAAVLSAVFCVPLLCRVPEQAPQWKLVWQDEFNRDGRLNGADWDYERGFVRNEELQFYQPDNAYCRGGLLVLEGRRERKPNPDYRPGNTGWRNREYIEVTSASVVTKNLHEFRYGRFEMRGRIDTRTGSWPAFWTLGTSIDGVDWPECGEIDIMEYYTGTVLANVCHGLAGREKWLTTKRPIAELGGEAWSSKFHTWAMEWDETRLDLYRDGERTAHFDVAGDDEPGKANAFRQPHYILLSQAIGGSSGGDPSALKYPVRFEADWVRIYRRER
jgi:beta-glucanase (GH16 family)